ncbi:MAG: 2Fe-2S iron-sulfur cluster-binding protein [Rhizobiaceae bacterium]
MPKVTWKLADGSEISVDVPIGHNMMQAAVANSVPGVVGECGGCLSCATCHVIVDEAWSEATGSFDDMEDAMLDCVETDRQDASRLSCQLECTQALDGLVLHLPAP